MLSQEHLRAEVKDFKAKSTSNQIRDFCENRAVRATHTEQIFRRVLLLFLILLSIRIFA
jgi:hypothetical protein